jgi:hypothetical protein
MVELTRRLRFAVLACAVLLAAAAPITAQSGGAMPTPASQAQPTPNKPRAGAEVTKVQLRPIKRRVGEPCPANMTFRGAITTNGATTVEYTWLSSDGRSWPTRNLKFAAAGTQSVTESWKLGQPGKTVEVWIQMQIVSPNRTFSNKVTENFTCVK